MEHPSAPDAPNAARPACEVPAGPGGAWPGPISPEAEGRAFWRLRRRIVASLLRQIATKARLRAGLIAVLSLMLWLSLYWLFLDGFAFLLDVLPAYEHARTVRTIFGTFYLTLMAMLVFSTGVILYSSLFRSADTAFLLTLPVRVERVFLHKLQEAVLLSSWAFLLLGSPMLLAYGVVEHAPWYYYAVLLPYLVAFACIPAGVGAALCLLIVRYLPGGMKLILAAAGLAMVAVGLSLVWTMTANATSDLLTPDWFQEKLSRLAITDNRLLPSWWLSSGLLAAASAHRRSFEPEWERQAWSEGVLFLALLIANALAIRQLSTFLAARIYRAAYNRLHGARPAQRKRHTSWVDRPILAAGVLSVPMRLLIVKDLRLFRRDPVQWSQFLIFVGLLLLYFLNINRFKYDYYYTAWVNMVSFLNVAVVGLLLSTFTTRFIFPLVSLEGRRFWVLGLMPVPRDTVLWAKFVFAAGGSILPCSALILLSDYMLRVRLLILLSHQLTCVILCLGLSGIAVGLGARMPSLREESPSRIAAGFGGTLNLVLSTLFILAVVMFTAMPAHFYLVSRYLSPPEVTFGRYRLGTWVQFWLTAGTSASLLLGAVATIVPMRLGLKAFRRLEF